MVIPTVKKGEGKTVEEYRRVTVNTVQGLSDGVSRKNKE